MHQCKRTYSDKIDYILIQLSTVFNKQLNYKYPKAGNLHRLPINILHHINKYIKRIAKRLRRIIMPGLQATQ